uniref:Uncharacterized protein n=1 Tax=Picea glauca TaxID=3330 RepID=A0A117NIK1_PICGL|nr:hypothetical protein ABT39_MTgene3273 [Picea glauca]QHR89220.1 hypothetical protein Q903MT_gene3240 [Picea sitchensis]
MLRMDMGLDLDLRLVKPGKPWGMELGRSVTLHRNCISTKIFHHDRTLLGISIYPQWHIQWMPDSIVRSLTLAFHYSHGHTYPCLIRPLDLI